MRVSALTWSRYRAFKERQRVDLAPVTLIIGRNGSGKSVISRLPLLLASALSREPEGPLNLIAGGVDHAASFQDLVNMRGALPFSVGLEISDGNTVYGFETTLRYVAETKSLSIERFTLNHNDDEIVTIEIANADQLTAANPIYNLTGFGLGQETQALNFSGLFPAHTGGEFGTHLLRIHEMFRTALPMPSYLGPFRVEPQRSSRLPSQSIRELGSRGERALELLADDRLRHGGQLTAQVADWFAKAMGQGIAVDVAGDQPQVFVKDLSSELEVSLADTGAGFSQVLPVVVQHFAHRLDRLHSKILIVEQPELHLHPAAHGDLADLLIDSSKFRDHGESMTCIAETHSEQFIMRVRRRVAEGLDPRNITLWSLNHQENLGDPVEPIRVIKFDQSGNPDTWPVGVFEESLDDLTKMRKASRARGL